MFYEPNTLQIKGKNTRDVYTKVYDERETILSGQAGQSSTGSQHGNKYLVVIVETGSNNILVEPQKSRKYPKMMLVYKTMMLQLKRAEIVPKHRFSTMKCQRQ